MEKLIVKAIDAKGHWAFGRFWPHAHATELEIVPEPAAERASDGEEYAVQQQKYALRCARIAAGKVTAVEAERIRAYPHLVEAKIEPCAQCEAHKARIVELEALLTEATAPKKGGK